MQIIHEDVFGNLAAVSVLYEIGTTTNKFLQQLGFGIDDPDIALKLRANEVIQLKPNSKLNIGKVRLFKYSSLMLKANTSLDMKDLLHLLLVILEFSGLFYLTSNTLLNNNLTTSLFFLVVIVT